MNMAEIEKTYKSPIHKLFSFFIRSRDEWKEKCKAAKALVKQLKNQAAKLQQSRQRWKEVAKKHASELKDLQRELDAQKT